MTIDEAIEIQNEIIRQGSLGNVLEAYPAMLLGIEALKRCNALRIFQNIDTWKLLPGETKD